MLSLFTRRVALPAHRSTAIYARILPSPASTLRARAVSDTRLHAGTVRTSSNPQRNASTKAGVTTTKAKPPTKSTTTGRAEPMRKLTPEQREDKARLLLAKQAADRLKKAAVAAALRAKQQARTVKEKEAAARKRKRLTEAKNKLAKAEKEKKEKEKKKEREKKKAMVEREKAREAKKKAIEANKPKLIKPPPRNMSGLMLLIQETKKSLREGAAMWRALSEEEKEKYAASARVIQAKRREEFDAFAKTVSRLELLRYNRAQRAKGKHGIRIKPRDPLPLTPFFKFGEEFRARPEMVGKRSVPEVATAAAVVWRSMTQEEKDRYKSRPTEPTTAENNSQSL